MNINDIYTGKRYVYRKPKQNGRTSYPILVEAIATDRSSNMVLVTHLNTNKRLNVNAANLEPIKHKPTQKE